MSQPTVFHIPVCPFCQRIQILLDLKGLPDAVRYQVVDVTVPRPPDLLRKTRGSTMLPVLETVDGRILKESMVILQYLDDVFPQHQVAQRDPYRRAVEGMLCRMEGDLVNAGYGWVMNQDRTRSDGLRDKLLAQYARIDDFLNEHAPDGTFLFEDFGWAEAVFTPIFMRFWFVEYYEGFQIPDESRYARVRRWVQACLAHPAAQQTSREEIVKLYYDYAKGAGNGALLPGRVKSSFVFEPDWRTRPWPPADKYGHSASDAELGLVG
jgi:glutathione S-transferase